MSVDGKLYHVRVESHTVLHYYLHEDWRSVIFEQVSTYDVNGVKGYGIFEFLYWSVTSVLSFLRFALCFYLSFNLEQYGIEIVRHFRTLSFKYWSVYFKFTLLVISLIILHRISQEAF